MLGGSRLRATVAVLAATTASLALAGTAGASSGAVIDAEDACDPASFNAAGIGCRRVDGSGKRVTIDKLFARVQKDRAHGAWRFHSDDVKVRPASRSRVASAAAASSTPSRRSPASAPGASRSSTP
jgi:hypothetical protein